MGRVRRHHARALLGRGALLVAVSSLGVTGPARARTTIVPDDFPTIQAAVDNVPQSAPVETLLVRGGSYPEGVLIRHRGMVIQAIPPLDGSDRMPEIAGMQVDEEGDGYAFIGLHFTEFVNVSSFAPDHVLFAGCRFDRGLQAGGSSDTLRLTRCILFQSAVIFPRVATLDSNIVHGPVFINTSDSAFVLDNRFESIEYRALTVRGRCTLVARNRVRGGGGFASFTEGDVRFEDNDIEGCRSGGIDSEARGTGHALLERNQIAHCGLPGLDDPGISVRGRGTVRGNLVLDCRGPGIHVDQGEGAGAVEDNVVGRCDFAGILLTNPYWWFRSPLVGPSTISVRGNTVYGCSGPGIEISYLPGSTIANNLVYACEGLSAADNDPLLISHNNWFPALGEPSSPTDLSVDPQFCDLSADDVRLRSDSPLLDVPGAGRIGALGKGCEAAPIAVGFDLTPNTLNLASRGRWVTGFLEPPATLAAGDIDVSTIRLNGTVAVDASAPSALTDHDGDGVADLMVKFDRTALELALPEGDEVTVTVTFETAGHRCAGTAVVWVRRGRISAPAPGDRLSAGSVQHVRWENLAGAHVASVALMLSTDAGGTWTRVIGAGPNTGGLEWMVPDTPTDRARVALVSIAPGAGSGDIADAVLAVSGDFSIGAVAGLGDRGNGIRILAIRSVGPNPSPRGRLRVEFTLRDDSPARLELLDVAGRVLSTRHLEALGSGVRALEVSEVGALPPGIYFLRLRQGRSEVRARAAVTR